MKQPDRILTVVEDVTDKESGSVNSYAPTVEIQDLWDKVHAAMREEFGEAVFRSWLKPLQLQAFYHNTLEVSVPTRFIRDWIQNHYALRILEMCQVHDKEIQRIEFVVAQSALHLKT